MKPDLNKPAFLVGVTGHMDLRDEELTALSERVEEVLKFHRDGVKNGHCAYECLRGNLPAPLVGPDRPFETVFDSWAGLRNTQLVVLSSLAPGADTLVANAALKLQIPVVAPLPLPADLYEQASTFHWPASGGASATELMELKKSNNARAEKYRELLKQVSPFVVRCARRAGEPEFLTPAQLELELADREKRHRRYYAAGAFIARAAHLLLAIWDDEHDANTDAGTAAIVAARQLGPRKGVLSDTGGQVLPPGGPTLQLVTHRRKNTHARRPGPALRFCLPPTAAAHDDAYKHKWEVEHLDLMRRIGKQLDDFNAVEQPDDEAVEKECDSRMAYAAKVGGPAAPSLPALLQKDSPELFQPLRGLLSIRRGASGEGSRLGDESHGMLRCLFWLTFGAAALVHAYAHWHPAGHHGDESGHLLRNGIGLSALVFAALSLLLFAVGRYRRRDERGHDYRALAEGLRVQFYWALAGVGRSVSDNYMERQRTELDWIRGAIRSAGLVLHPCPEYFANLSPAAQISALRATLQSWLQNQRDFFRDRLEQNRRLLHFCHTLGGWLAVAGLVTFGCAWACGLHGAGEWIAEYGTILALVAAFGLAGWWAFGHYRRSRDEHARRRREKTLSKQITADAIWLTERMVPASELHAPDPGAKVKRVLRMAGRFAVVLIPAILLALIVQGVAHQHRIVDWVPSAENTTIIIAGVLGLGGALVVAWGDKSLYSELAYQYGTMYTLFESAHERLARLIDQLEDPKLSSTEFAEKREEIQEFLVALGKEALDENAEWLILHRARPLEPVMAG